MEKGIKRIIGDKMRCLDDFGICDRLDVSMREELERVIAENPGKDPQEVLDYYCRPMIQKVVNSWK